MLIKNKKVAAVFAIAIAFLKKYRRIITLLGTPFILSPIIISVDSNYPDYGQEARAAYGIAIMAVFWITEVTDLAVTSLLPLLIFPFLGVLKAKEASMQYMKDTNILLLGGLLIAVAIEQWNVHKRVALTVLLYIGAQPRRLLFGFMLVTAVISMWITNTATTAMMTPIMEAVLKQLDKQFERETGIKSSGESGDGDNEVGLENNHLSQNDGTTAETSSSKKTTMSDLELEKLQDPQESDSILIKSHEITKAEKKHKQLCKCMLLSICYSANIGGTGTLTGTAPQLVLAGQARDMFKDGPAISFVYWFVYAFPQMLLFLFIGWIYLQVIFMGIGFKHLCFFFRCKKRNKGKGKAIYAAMSKQYAELGPITYAEVTVLVSFVLLVLLWFFREPKFMPGWGDVFKHDYITDGTAAMIIAFLLFQLPSQIPDCLNFFYIRKDRSKPKTILTWKDTQKKFPWNVLFLLGAGFALAKACSDSGLSKMLSCKLSTLQSIPEAAIVFIICVMLTFLTEVTSNTATATILLPVLGSLATSIQVHPYYLMIPATVCASFAFMLPVATPPNAIVFATGRLRVVDMAVAGFGMNIIGILIVTLSINTWGMSYYGLDKFPDWAARGNTTDDCAKYL